MTRSAMSPDKSAFNEQTPLYNSGILGNYINYLESHHVDVDTDELLRCTGLTRFDINDEGHFFSQEQINDFHRCLDEKLADPKISYKVGQHALYMKSTGTIMQYGLQFITPGAMYKAVDRIYSKWSRGHLSKTTITGKGRAEVTVSAMPGVRDLPFQCENRLGIFEAIGKVVTGLPARVTHPKCMHRGDDACQYLIAWEEKPSAIWKRLGAYAGVCSAIIATGALFFMPTTSWVLLTLAMAVACLSISLVGSTLGKKELTGFLKEQGDTAGHLLEEIENRYHNARLVQEIGQAGANILEVNTFLNTVLESMSRNLDFTRGMIALCDERRQQLCHGASYGFSQEERHFLGAIDIDFYNSSDMFIQAMKNGRPIVLNEITGKTAEMAPNSVHLIDKLHVDALISVPLIHKKEPLGLLFVDSRGAIRDLTTSDVNLLMGIASQIATGIINARSYSRLQESEQRYRLLADNVTDIIWVLDIETLKMKYVSPSVKNIQGYTPDEAVTLSIDQYLAPDSFQQATAALAKTLESITAGELDPKSYSITLELDTYHKDGSIVPIEVTAGFLLDENGKPNAVLGIARDLSGRKKAEKERTEIEKKLQRAKKMESLGTMAGSIAHNFNNLLMVVLGNLELAKEGLPETSTTARNILRATHASQRAADLSSMMLTYVGVGSGSG
ncbi:MAG: PAS domain S-box protein [Desulfosarcina sp.]|nr:PAS domain S-box protein [Desulfosarcina sp.]